MKWEHLYLAYFSSWLKNTRKNLNLSHYHRVRMCLILHWKAGYLIFIFKMIKCFCFLYILNYFVFFMSLVWLSFWIFLLTFACENDIFISFYSSELALLGSEIIISNFWWILNFQILVAFYHNIIFFCLMIVHETWKKTSCS